MDLYIHKGAINIQNIYVLIIIKEEKVINFRVDRRDMREVGVRDDEILYSYVEFLKQTKMK